MDLAKSRVAIERSFGGRSWVAASHTTAAVRMASSLDTPMPTPVATAQLSASAQDERRSAGTGSREAWPSPFHAVSIRRCVTNPASAPAP
jgi:hypothetical protein